MNRLASTWKLSGRVGISLVVAGVATLLLVAPLQNVPAQERRRESVLLTTEAIAIRRLESAREHLRAGQWEEAIPLLRQAADQHGETWIPVGEGRYLPVQVGCEMLLATLPKEALVEYRRRIDPQARRWFEEASATRDEALLAKLVRQAFVSSYGDDALWLLGELAFERGEFSQARSCWSRLLNPAGPRPADAWPLSAAYPDSQFDPAQVRARLILCSAMEANWTQAQKELDKFAELHSEARGTLAGKTGVLGEILAAVLNEARQTEPLSLNSDTATFAGNGQRNGVAPRTYDLGGSLWSIPLPPFPKPLELGERMEREVFTLRPPPTAALPVYFPAVVGNVVILCDESSVYAIDLYRGVPAWPIEGDPEIDADDVRNQVSSALLQSRIYKLPQELRPRVGEPDEVVGVPAFAPTVDRGRVYVRLGTVSRRHHVNMKRAPRGFLVSLDLAQEGKHLATIDSDSITYVGGRWTFEGAPVIGGDRVLISLRRHEPQPQVAVACYDLSLQRLLWIRDVCIGSTSIAGEGVEISHQLLTVTGDRVLYNTNLGAVAALNLADGAPLWLTTYEHVELTPNELRERSRLGPNPCVVHGDSVYVSPTDSPHVLAFELLTGRLKWQQDFRSEDLFRRDGRNFFGRRSPKPFCLLGVADDKLIAAGEALWALDLESGKPTVTGHDDPDSAKSVYGRGLLAGAMSYTTSRDTLFVREAATGVSDRLPADCPGATNRLLEHGCPGGGNLVLAKGALLVAQANKLTCISELATLRSQQSNEIAKAPRDPVRQYLLGLLEQAQDLPGNAQTHFKDARGLTPENAVWEGLPLAAAIARSEFAVRMDSGNRLRMAQQPEEAAADYLTAAEVAPSPHQKILALQGAAVSWIEANKPDRSLLAWQAMLDDAALRTTSTGVGISAEVRAERQILSLIKTQGRAVYAEVEHRAQAAFQSAEKAANLERLDALMDQFPHALATRDSGLRLIEVYLQRDEPALALRTVRRLSSKLTEPDDRSRLLVLAARSAERLRHWETARDLWISLARQHPKAVIAAGGTDQTADAFVPTHLATAEFRKPRSDTSPFLSRLWTSTGEGAMPLVPKGTPADASLGCVLFVDTQLQGVDLRSGHLRWRQPLNNRPRWSAFLGDWLITADDQTLSAFDPASGRNVWTKSVAGESFRTDGQRIFCRQTDGSIVAIAGPDGRPLWTYQPQGTTRPHWQASHGRVLLQTTQPASVVLLSSLDGGILTVHPGSEEPWLSDPVPLADGSMAVVMGPLEVQILDADSASPRWSEKLVGRPAHVPHAILPAGSDLVVVRDGTVATRLNGQDGKAQWPEPRRVASLPLTHAAEATCSDGQRLFVASAGIVRCFELTTGKLAWEQLVGNSAADWRIDRIGRCVVTWPAESNPQAAITVCDTATGALVQRIALPSEQPFTVQTTPRAVIVAAGNELTALGTTQ